MAVLPFDLEEEERKKQEAAMGGGTDPGQVAGAPQTSPGGAPAGGDAPTGGSPQTRGTSGFTDVNAYLDANQEQAVGTAQKIAGRLGEQASGIRGDIDTAKTGFQNKINQNTVNLDEDLTNRAFADPTAFTQNAEDVAKFKKQRDASYAGPGAFNEADEYGSLIQKIGDANQKAKSIDTESGREQLLAGVMTNPTKGMTSLDNLLIGANPNARNVLSEGAKPFAELQGYLDTAGTASNAAVQAAKGTTSATSQTVKDRLAAAIPEFEKGLDTKLTAARETAVANLAKEPALVGNLKAFYKDPTALSADDLKLLGISKEEAKGLSKNMNMMGVSQGEFDNRYSLINPNVYTADPDRMSSWKQYLDPSKFDIKNFLSQTGLPDVAINRGNVASAEDYARLASLGNLADADYGNILNPSDASKAGTAGLDLGGFDVAGATGLSKSLNEDAVRKWSADEGAFNAKTNQSILGGPYLDQDPTTLFNKRLIAQGNVLDEAKAPPPVNPPPPSVPTPLVPGDTSTPETGGSPTGNGQPYSEGDVQTWTMDQHPTNTKWMNGFGWVQMSNYVNPPTYQPGQGHRPTPQPK